VDDLLPDGVHEDVWAGRTGRVSHGTLRHVEAPPRSGIVFVSERRGSG
jgi:hypothetical protein